jgi:hypothetical protein
MDESLATVVVGSSQLAIFAYITLSCLRWRNILASNVLCYCHLLTIFKKLTRHRIQALGQCWSPSRLQYGKTSNLSQSLGTCKVHRCGREITRSRWVWIRHTKNGHIGMWYPQSCLASYRYFTFAVLTATTNAASNAYAQLRHEISRSKLLLHDTSAGICTQNDATASQLLRMPITCSAKERGFVVQLAGRGFDSTPHWIYKTPHFLLLVNTRSLF